VDDSSNLGPLECVAVLVLNIAFREAYNAHMFQDQYPVIDIHFILSHVVFEGRLSISNLKNRAIYHKHLHLEIVKFLKKAKVFKGRLPTLFHTPLFFKPCIACQSFRDDWNIFKK
jgi:hypothetical protein